MCAQPFIHPTENEMPQTGLVGFTGGNGGGLDGRPVPVTSLPSTLYSEFLKRKNRRMAKHPIQCKLLKVYKRYRQKKLSNKYDITVESESSFTTKYLLKYSKELILEKKKKTPYRIFLFTQQSTCGGNRIQKPCRDYQC